MLLTKQKILLLICLLFLAATPVLVSARGLVPCGGYADEKGTREAPCTFLDIFNLVAKVTNWLVGVAGIYAVYKMLEHGFALIYAMGNEESITQHKGGITNAVVGFVLVMMAYILINTVLNFILLGASPAGAKINLKDPCTYLDANSSCVGGK